MKKLLVGSVSLFVLASVSFVGTANAADAPMASPDSTYDWTGWYWGLKGGGGGGDANLTGAGGSSGDYSIEGGLFGTMSGYNFQSDRFVFGLDMDSGFGNIDGTTSAANVCASCTSEINWLSTVRGRAGITMGSRGQLLPFVTAGVAFGEVEVTIPGALGGNSDDVFVGFAVGGGLDWAFAEGWVARIDYQYVDLGDETLAFAGGSTLVEVDNLHVVRVGISKNIDGLFDRIFGGS